MKAKEVEALATTIATVVKEAIDERTKLLAARVAALEQHNQQLEQRNKRLEDRVLQLEATESARTVTR